MLFLLSHQDSNLDEQIQRLVCYHYTMGQFGLQNYNFFLIIKMKFTVFL